jgi:hypothetical protein
LVETNHQSVCNERVTFDGEAANLMVPGCW